HFYSMAFTSYAINDKGQFFLKKCTQLFVPCNRWVKDSRIIFPTGLIYHQSRKSLVVSYGEADVSCRLVTFDLHDVLNKLLPPVDLAKRKVFDPDLFGAWDQRIINGGTQTQQPPQEMGYVSWSLPVANVWNDHSPALHFVDAIFWLDASKRRTIT